MNKLKFAPDFFLVHEETILKYHPVCFISLYVPSFPY